MNKLRILIIVIFIIFIFNGCYENNNETYVVIHGNIIKNIENNWIIFNNGMQINIKDVMFVISYKNSGYAMIKFSLKYEKNVYIRCDNYDVCERTTNIINEYLRRKND